MKASTLSLILVLLVNVLTAQFEYVGEFSNEVERLDEPDCITISGDFIYAQDDDNANVAVFNKITQTKVATFGGSELGTSNGGIAVLGTFIFVADNNADEIEVYNITDYSHVATIPITEVNNLEGLAAGNGYLFVGDVTSVNVEVYSAIPPFSHSTTITNAAFNSIQSLTFDSGKLYVSDSSSDKIFIHDGNSPYTEIGSLNVSLNSESGVAVDAGIIYSITSSDVINAYSDISPYGLIGSFNEDHLLGDPECIVADGGTIYVAEDNDDIIHIYRNINQIPTIGQWGLFILGMLFSTIALIVLYQNRTKIA